MKREALAVSDKQHYSLQQLVCKLNCVRRPAVNNMTGFPCYKSRFFTNSSTNRY